MSIKLNYNKCMNIESYLFVYIHTIMPTTTAPRIQRLNYIGSKYQLLDWVTDFIKEKTGFDSFKNKIGRAHV